MVTREEVHNIYKRANREIKFFDSLESKILDAAAQGKSYLSVAVDTVPSNRSRRDIIADAEKYFGSFGFKVSSLTNCKRFDIEWD